MVINIDRDGEDDGAIRYDDFVEDLICGNDGVMLKII